MKIPLPGVNPKKHAHAVAREADRRYLAREFQDLERHGWIEIGSTPSLGLVAAYLYECGWEPEDLLLKKAQEMANRAARENNWHPDSNIGDVLTSLAYEALQIGQQMAREEGA